MLLASFAGEEAAAVRTAVRKGVRDDPSELLLNECTNCLSNVVAADKFSDVGPPLMMVRELLTLLLVEEELVGEALKLEERFFLPIILSYLQIDRGWMDVVA